jgi:hypothetical protein
MIREFLTGLTIEQGFGWRISRWSKEKRRIPEWNAPPVVEVVLR